MSALYKSAERSTPQNNWHPAAHRESLQCLAFWSNDKSVKLVKYNSQIAYSSYLMYCNKSPDRSSMIPLSNGLLCISKPQYSALSIRRRSCAPCIFCNKCECFYGYTVTSRVLLWKLHHDLCLITEVTARGLNSSEPRHLPSLGSWTKEDHRQKIWYMPTFIMIHVLCLALPSVLFVATSK